MTIIFEFTDQSVRQFIRDAVNAREGSVTWDTEESIEAKFTKPSEFTPLALGLWRVKMEAMLYDFFHLPITSIKFRKD